MITWEVSVLAALALAFVAALQGEVTHWLGGDLPGRWPRVWLYLRALGTGGAVWISYAYVEVPAVVLWGLTALAAALGVLGYWQKGQNLSYRIFKA